MVTILALAGGVALVGGVALAGSGSVVLTVLGAVRLGRCISRYWDHRDATVARFRITVCG